MPKLKSLFNLRRRQKLSTSQQSLHWTKLDKPLREMTPEERRVFAEKLALESLKVLTSEERKNKKDFS